jgi:hypothetical protein
MPSLQLGTLHMPSLHKPLTHCSSALQRCPRSQPASHVGPQSTAVSVPFSKPSRHVSTGSACSGDVCAYSGNEHPAVSATITSQEAGFTNSIVTCVIRRR